jgi:hypothetical protein
VALGANPDACERGWVGRVEMRDEKETMRKKESDTRERAERRGAGVSSKEKDRSTVIRKRGTNVK